MATQVTDKMELTAPKAEVIEKDGSLSLGEAVVHLFNAHMSEVLDILSSRFPHVREDRSINEVEFQGLRAKVLRSGNNKIRRLPDILKQYQIVQLFDTETKVIEVGQPYRVKETPHA